MKIAIIAWGAMADVLYATSIVRYIRQLHPDAHITWLIRDRFREVVETNPDIDKVKGFRLPEGYKTRQDAEYQMDAEIVAHSMVFDKVYDLQYWPRYTNFYERPNEDFLSLRARNAGLNPAAIVNRRVVLEPRVDEDRFFDMFPSWCWKRVICINHISYAASPIWTEDKYIQLAKGITGMGLIPLFGGGENEWTPPIARRDAMGISYREWAECIRRCSLWLGLDSGAKAIAAAFDQPMIVLHSRDFPLHKTGVRAMGLRTDDGVLELNHTPTVDSVLSLIKDRRRWKA